MLPAIDRAGEGLYFERYLAEERGMASYTVVRMIPLLVNTWYF